MSENQKPFQPQTDEAKFESRAPGVPAVQQDNSTNALVMMAMEKGYDPAFIEKMMDLRDREEAREASKAYVQAMARFKANPPEILKTAHVSYQKKDQSWTEYDHAVLGEIAEAVNIAMAKEGLYPRWDMTQTEILISVTCIITHEMGHHETFGPISAPPDTSGNKNAIQAISSTNSYLQRITLLGGSGLAAKGMDHDGQDKPGEVVFINDQQFADITSLISEVGADEKKFIKYLKIKSLDKMPEKLYTKAVEELERKKK